jgi:hypothetical protein
MHKCVICEKCLVRNLIFENTWELLMWNNAYLLAHPLHMDSEWRWYSKYTRSDSRDIYRRRHISIRRCRKLPPAPTQPIWIIIIAWNFNWWCSGEFYLYSSRVFSEFYPKGEIWGKTWSRDHPTQRPQNGQNFVPNFLNFFNGIGFFCVPLVLKYLYLLQEIDFWVKINY